MHLKWRLSLMKSKIYNYAIEKAIYTAEFNIEEFTSYSSSPEFHEFINIGNVRRKIYSFSIKDIADLLLRRRLLEYLMFCMDNRTLSPVSFVQYRIRALRTTIFSHPTLYSTTYEEFLSHSIKKLEVVYSKNAYVISFLHTFFKYCYEYDYKDNIFESDIWTIDNFNISFERNASLRFKHFNFLDFQNNENKYFVKKYIEYCLCNTDNTINTISGRLSCLKLMLKDSKRSYSDWNENDSQTFINNLMERYKNKRTLASRMISYYHFTDYLLIHDYIDNNPLKKYHSLCSIGTFRHSTIAVDDYVISQIFRVLGDIEDKRLVLIFLLIYCVGMRVSEACGVTTDCLEKNEKGEFIKYYCLKMKKEVCNVIPLALYEMIYEYQYTLALGNHKFLFNNSTLHDSPISTSTFTKRFNTELNKNNVKNKDGSIYIFRPHAFRHKMAVNMRRLDIPFQVIQEQLHHASPEMTLAYIEYIDRDIIRKMDEYIDINGNKDKSIEELILSENKKYADYMRKTINAQLLPNGICSRPVSLGKCCHENACLTCPEYRTSKAYLDVHKKHLKSINEYITIAEKNGWLPQLESSKKTKSILLKIISKLEGSVNI